MTPVRIVIADDHELVRYALETVIDGEQDLSVIAHAKDGVEAVEIVRREKPDVLLLDLRMPNMDGIEACRAVRTASPDTRVLILTSFGDDDEVFGALSAGAHGYLMKDVAPKALLESIRGIAKGRTVIDASVADRIVDGQERRQAVMDEEGLSPREIEVLTLIAGGSSNREIGAKLFISEATVKTHVSHVLAKLGQTDRVNAALVAIRRGLVDIERDE